MNHRIALRAKIISRIEGAAGDMLSMPYEQITTPDLLKLANALYLKEYPTGIPEYWEYMNSDLILD